MTHEEAALLLGAVALDAASADEERRVRAHAVSCAVCRHELATYDTLVRLLDPQRHRDDRGGPSAGT